MPSLAFIDAKDWESYEREQRLITAGLERMEAKTKYYGKFDVCKIQARSSKTFGYMDGV